MLFSSLSNVVFFEGLFAAALLVAALRMLQARLAMSVYPARRPLAGRK